MTIEERLERIEEMLLTLIDRQQFKDFYSTAEVASLMERAEWTVRNWCRLGRIHAEKIGYGRGNSEEWRISHSELLRIQNEGLLPLRLMAADKLES